MRLFLAIVILLFSFDSMAWDQRGHGRNYSSSPFSTQNSIIRFKLIDPTSSVGDFRTSAPSITNADCFISKDNGPFTNCANNPSWQGNGTVSLQITAAEADAALIEISLIDQSGTKQWVDTAWQITTGGSCGAMFQSASSPCNPAP